MSVNEGDRKDGRLEVLVKGKKLASYTIRICCNEKWFPNIYKNAITDRIISIATDIFTKCWTANNIRVENNPEKAKRRCGLQTEAHDECNELLSLMQIAQEVFHLRTRRMKYWGELTVSVRNLISAWKERDSSRYNLLL